MSRIPPAWWAREVMHCHCGAKILRFFDGKEYHYHDWWQECSEVEVCPTCGSDVREVHHFQEAISLMEGLA